jgi:hypothetical protein
MTKQRVKIGLAIVGCMAMVWAWPAWGAEDGKQTIQLFVTGFSVAKPVDGSATDSQAGFLPPGTKVYLRHVMPAGLSLVKFDQRACTLTKFVDSTGKNLAKPMKKKEKFSRPAGFRVSSFRKDGVRKVRLELASPRVPAKTATSITAEGSLVATVASGLKEVTTKDIALEKGTKFSLGDLQMKVTKTKESKNWKNKKVFEVTFETTGPVETMERVSMTKADGQKIKCRRGMVSSFRVGTSTTTSVTYVLDEAVDSVTIKANMYQGMRTLTCPVKMTFSVGL